MLRTGSTQKEIASIIGTTPSTVCQELKRNSDADGVYRASIAKERTRERRKHANQRFRKIRNNEWLKKCIEKHLRKHWSPEQISGRLKKDYPKERDKHIGKDALYRWVYEERKGLVKFLRCKKGSYRRRRGTRIREKQREEAKIKRIYTRDGIVEKRERIGDWEGDTVLGKEKTSRLLTNVERKSGYGIIDILPSVTMERIHETLRKRFARISKGKRFTYTYDNGSELGKEDASLEEKIGMEVYRAYPYHSWERGSNENFNGLLREFFPKGTEFATITQKDVKRVERLLNNRPRKRLGYATPKEVFFGKN